MANIIQIKRSLLSAAPASLAEGEMAYVYGTDTLYIGAPSNTMIIIAGASTYAKLANPTFTGTVTAPLLKITGGTPAAGKVLTSDADGDATWQTPNNGVTDHTLLSNIGTNTHAQIDTHIASTANPHGVTKTQVGLSNVDNTSDTNKPVSTAQQNILNTKADLVSGKVPASQLPAYVDDVLEYANLAGFPTTGISSIIYIALDSNKTYRWGGTSYTQITSGAVDSVNGYTGVVALVKADIGLANVDNTSDVNKPVSTAQATSIGLKLAIANNLSDLSNAATARTNLGLGSMATQNANAVAITGGTINGITIDGGTF